MKGKKRVEENHKCREGMESDRMAKREGRGNNGR